MKVLMAKVCYLNDNWVTVDKWYIKVFNPTIETLEDLKIGEHYMMNEWDYVAKMAIYTFKDNVPIDISADWMLSTNNMSSETVIF